LGETEEKSASRKRALTYYSQDHENPQRKEARRADVAFEQWQRKSSL
jgi:hypothetical protein